MYFKKGRFPVMTEITRILAVNIGRQVFFVIVPAPVAILTQGGTSVYLGQTHLGTPLQVPAWVRKFSLGSTGD